jgi:hypothetical protein
MAGAAPAKTANGHQIQQQIFEGRVMPANNELARFLLRQWSIATWAG